MNMKRLTLLTVALFAVLVMGLGAGRTDAGMFWQWDCDVDPTTLDSNGDGIGDWVVRNQPAGTGFLESSLTTDGDLTVYAGGAGFLDTRPLYDATDEHLAVVVKWKISNTATTGFNSILWWNLDFTGTDFARLWCRVNVVGGNTNINMFYDGRTGGAPNAVITVSGTDYFTMRWQINTVANTVAVYINGEENPRGTYTYTPFAGTTADRFVTLGLGAGLGYVDYIRVYAGDLCIPENGAEGVELNPTLSWDAPDPESLADPNNVDKLQYDVYFDADQSLVADGDASVRFGPQDATDWSPFVALGSDLFPDTTYYWRVDVIEPNEPEPFVYPGQVWSFTTVSLKATNPSPANGAEGVAQNAVLSWDAGPGAVAHDVYFGTDADLVFASDASVDFGRQSETDFAPDMDWETQYFWRVDVVFADEVVTGDVWSFTTTGTRICAEPIIGDINEDCVVDLKDMALMVGDWMKCNLTNGDCP